MKAKTLLILFLLSAALQGAETAVIRSLQAETTEEAFTEKPSAIEGVVTWADPASENFFYLQDETGGMQVIPADGIKPKLGQLVRADGVLNRGSFAPVLTGATLEILGESELPKHRDSSGGGLLNGSYNGERVDVNAWIRTAKMTGVDTLELVVDSGASRITLRISDFPDADLEKLIAAKIRARGVAHPIKVRSARRELVEVEVLVPRKEDLILDWVQKVSPWDQEVVPLRLAFSYRPGQSRGDRLHVRGKVMLVGGDTAYINDGESGLAIRSETMPGIRVGKWIEAVGFRDLENFLPVLSDVVIRPDGVEPVPVTPSPVSTADLLQGHHHSGYVAVTGRLLDQTIAPDAMDRGHHLFTVQSGEGLFQAEIFGKSAGTGLHSFENGSLLRITGICSLTTDGRGDPTDFRILVPDPSSITVVQPAPYFTVKRLLVMLAIALGVLLAASLLSLFLAGRNVKLKAEILERRAVAGERTRMARDLHDSLEQALSGIHLQLHSLTLAANDAAPSLTDRMKNVAKLVNQCHGEIRQSIWNLRATAVEDFNLGQALKRSAQSLFLGSGVEVITELAPRSAKIPPLIEDNLLRIAQEAMTNALKHAEATIIRIVLENDAEGVSITVSDDGKGMDFEQVRSQYGHFGIIGMEERAERIGGHLKITSSPSDGTIISIHVPAKPERHSP